MSYNNKLEPHPMKPKKKKTNDLILVHLSTPFFFPCFNPLFLWVIAFVLLLVINQMKLYYVNCFCEDLICGSELGFLWGALRSTDTESSLLHGDGVLLLSAALVPVHSGSPPESPCNHPRFLLPSGIISVSCPWSAAAARVRGTRASDNNSHGSIGEERWWRRPSFPQGCCI